LFRVFQEDRNDIRPPDTDVTVEVYPDADETGTTLWRDVHMGAYNLASQELVKHLQKMGEETPHGREVKKDLLFVNNEVFASMPTGQFPDAIHHHINHTVFRPGLYKPNAVSYELLGFPEHLRPYLIYPFPLFRGSCASTSFFRSFSFLFTVF